MGVFTVCLAPAAQLWVGQRADPTLKRDSVYSVFQLIHLPAGLGN